MSFKILLALVLVQQLLLAPHVSPARAQAGGLGVPTQSREDPAANVLQIALERMAASDAEGAVHLLRPVARKSAVPLEAQRAKCLLGAAYAMNAELRSSEQTADVLNNPSAAGRLEAGAAGMPAAASDPSAAAEAAWKQVLPECQRQLQSIAPRLKPDRRSVVFYYLGMIGTDETEHIRYLRQSVKLVPRFSEAGYQLGLHLLGNTELTEAAEVLRRVAQQRPGWAQPRGHLGMLLTLTGQPDEAVQELRQALKIEPNFAEAHGQLCLALYATGDYTGALTHGGRAANQQPKNPFHHNCAALVLLEKNQSLEALGYARRSTELVPGHETFQVVLAAALKATGRQQEALTAMYRALAAQPALRTDPARLEKANMLRGRTLQLARQVLQRATSSDQSARGNP